MEKLCKSLEYPQSDSRAEERYLRLRYSLEYVTEDRAVIEKAIENRELYIMGFFELMI
jgi:hypothetical protein